jgi:hypothetical protein
MKRLGSLVSSGFSKVLRPVGLVAALALVLVGAPGAAMAAGWHGGGGGHVGGGHFGGGAVHAGVGFHGGGWRGGGAVASPRYAQVPGGAYHKGYSPNYYNHYYATPTRAVARVYVPGYWGWRGGARVWVGPTWAYPPSPGWVWVPAHWAWNGYSWVWQNAYWAPPY